VYCVGGQTNQSILITTVLVHLRVLRRVRSGPSNSTRIHYDTDRLDISTSISDRNRFAGNALETSFPRNLEFGDSLSG